MYKVILTFLLLGIIIYLIFWDESSKVEKMGEKDLTKLAQESIDSQKYIKEQIKLYTKDKKFDPIHIAFILKSFNDSTTSTNRIQVFTDSVKSYLDSNLAEKVYFKLRLASGNEEDEKTVIYAGLLAKLITTEGKIGTLSLDKDQRENMFKYINEVISDEKIVILF